VADTKISDLTPLLAGDLAGGDLLPIVDITAGATKSLTITALSTLFDPAGSAAAAGAAAAAASQPLDADLTAIAALSGTNTLYYRSGAGAWSAVTIGTNLSFAGGTLSATGGAPGGSDTQVQFNDGGAFGGDDSLLWNKTTNQLTIGGSILIGTGTMSVGTSGAGVLVLGNSTAPTSAPADEVQLFSADYTAGDARLQVLSESGTGLWVGNGTLEAVAPASGAGNSLTIRASNAVSGNTNGGDLVLETTTGAGTGLRGFVQINRVSAPPVFGAVPVVTTLRLYDSTRICAGISFLGGTVNKGEAVIYSLMGSGHGNLMIACQGGGGIGPLFKAHYPYTNIGAGVTNTLTFDVAAHLAVLGGSSVGIPLCILRGMSGQTADYLKAVTSTNVEMLVINASGQIRGGTPASGAGINLVIGGSNAVSGNTNGGDVVLIGGAGSGSGVTGNVDATGARAILVPAGTSSLPSLQFSNGNGFYAYSTTGIGLICSSLFGVFLSQAANFNSGTAIGWTGTSDPTISRDTGMHRGAAGVTRLSNGTTGPGGLSSAAQTPAQITADQNNYSPSVGLFQRWSSDASRNVTGVVAGVDGETRFVWNVGTQNIVLQNENASSTAANRMTTSTGADLTLSANKCALMMYSTTTSRWLVTLLP
jgi:hypothetical protein